MSLDKKKRDDFAPATIELLCKRASYICSNPDCRSLTLSPSQEDSEKVIYVGVAAHITAAASNGPRYDSSITSEQRGAIENAIFLCAFCANMIDKNGGIDFPAQLLKNWKIDHEAWVRSNLNKSVTSLISTVDGEHYAKGKGDIVGLDAQGPVFIRPGTRVVAEGEGNITGTRIGFRGKEDK
ncbi:MAG: hypothetical protein IPO81_25410 [Kouleothrix sp.]|nr:hypothetical protein [Kouleothrix sp.]